MSVTRPRGPLIAILLLALTPAIAVGATLSDVYRQILSGDYAGAQVQVAELLASQPDDSEVSRVDAWLKHYDDVIETRKDVKSRTFDWNIERAREAREADRVYLALTFDARAREYTLDPDNDAIDPYAEIAWVDDLVSAGRTIAEQHEANGEWIDAAAHYALLARIRPNDDLIEASRKAAVRHARLEVLYEDEEEFERRVDGVRFHLLHSAVARIDGSYFKRPDFKEMALASLENLQALAESGEHFDYLDGLANPANREFFISELAKLRRSVESRDRYSMNNFLRLFKAVEDLNRRSIEAPTGMLVIEFLEGGLERLDTFTSVVWPADSREFDKMMTGAFEGVGIQLGVDDYTNRLKVVTPLENSPSLEAGVQAGDLIVKVDGESTKGWSTTDAVRNIMGPAGSDVVLTMYRPSTGEYLPFTLTRRQIKLKTVRGLDRLDEGRSENWNYMLDPDNGVAYVRLVGFHPESASELAGALNDARDQGMRGLILDLRHNPGGLLDVAIEIVSMFLDHGDVVSTDGLTEARERYRTRGRALYPDVPLIVLVNEASASASEILAGALQDHDRAIVLGDRTFGKGSVQRVLPLSQDGARLKLTTALYYLPSGRTPNRAPDAERWGVDPDIEVMLNPKEYRKVVQRENRSYVIKGSVATPEPVSPDTLEELADSVEAEDGELLSREDVELLAADPIEVPDVDPQLETALLHMRARLVGRTPWPKNIAIRAERGPLK